MSASVVGPLTGRHIVITNWRDSRHPRAGGAERYCEQTALELSELGARVTLLTSRPPGVAAVERTDYGTVVRFGGTLGTYPLGLWWLLRRRSTIDAVLDSENGIPYFSPLAVRRRTPVVLLIHHVHQRQFEQYLSPAAAAVGKFLEKRVARWVYGRRPVCVVSPSGRAEVRKLLAFKGPVFVAPNGLGPAAPHLLVERSAAPSIVCVGRLVPHKRVELLLGCLPTLLRRWPDLTVRIVGEGEEMAALRAESSRLGVDAAVHFSGRLDDHERDEVVSTAWLTVNPSSGEGWGLSVLEAARHGVPAVAFQVPGLTDSVRDGVTGWLVEEPEELAGAIDQALEVLAHPAEAEGYAVRCRAWAATFSWESTARRILSVIVSEADRLQEGLDERRRQSDATTVVELPRAVVSDGIIERLRRSDQLRVTPEHVELLLGGADEIDAAAALERLGLPPELAAGARVARHYDLLGWMARPDPELGLEVALSDLAATTEVVEMQDRSGKVVLLRPWGEPEGGYDVVSEQR